VCVRERERKRDGVCTRESKESVCMFLYMSMSKREREMVCVLERVRSVCVCVLVYDRV
jgi:hypothetical protein